MFKKALLALALISSASASVASDIPFSWKAFNTNNQYEIDLVNKLRSDGTTHADIQECNRWTTSDKNSVYYYDLANITGCHFIIHAFTVRLIDGYFHDHIRTHNH